jgi:hypothetical protein
MIACKDFRKSCWIGIDIDIGIPWPRVDRSIDRSMNRTAPMLTHANRLTN